MGCSVRAVASKSKGIPEGGVEVEYVASIVFEESGGGRMNVRRFVNLYLKALGEMRPINGYEYRKH